MRFKRDLLRVTVAEISDQCYVRARSTKILAPQSRCAEIAAVRHADGESLMHPMFPERLVHDLRRDQAKLAALPFLGVRRLPVDFLAPGIHRIFLPLLLMLLGNKAVVGDHDAPAAVLIGNDDRCEAVPIHLFGPRRQRAAITNGIELLGEFFARCRTVIGAHIGRFYIRQIYLAFQVVDLRSHPDTA